MRKFFSQEVIFIGHNIIRWDIPTLEKILGIKINGTFIDTLALSWYLEPNRPKHGLEGYGVDFGVAKPQIDNWLDLSIEEYCHRCEEDVEINYRLWKYQHRRLMAVYQTKEALDKFLDYLMDKIDCAREQEKSRWHLDVELCSKTLAKLEIEKEEKIIGLSVAMPKVPIRVKKKKPAKPFKADGTLSSHGVKWFDLLREHNYEEDYEGEVVVITGYDDPNPNSPEQVKDWLFDLGWVPQTFKYLRDKKSGDIRKIPQIRDDKTGELCASVKALIEKEEAISILDGLSILKHRIPMLSGFLEAMDENQTVYAGVQGLTNTLRFKHAVCVNLPKIDRPYGLEIRGSLIAPDGFELCGSDMASLEDRIKQHFLYKFDPDYVNSLNEEGYDPHLTIAKMANLVTEDEITFYKYYDGLKEEERSKVNNPNAGSEFKALKTIRGKAKNANYACQYGAGVSRIALTASISEAEASILHKAYWDLNWAIKAVAKEQITKDVDGQMWLLNPINGFWYTLRFEKDIFSTLVQGTASYCFDLWVRNFRKHRPQVTAQFHDEVVLCVREGSREKCRKMLSDAIDETNNQLKLNRELGVSMDFGKRYSDIH